MKTTDKEKLEQAIELLQQAYSKVHCGASYRNDELELIRDASLQKDIALFVNENSSKIKLTVPAVYNNPYYNPCLVA